VFVHVFCGGWFAEFSGQVLQMLDEVFPTHAGRLVSEMKNLFPCPTDLAKSGHSVCVLKAICRTFEQALENMEVRRELSQALWHSACLTCSALQV
jgi:hypothetical protein